MYQIIALLSDIIRTIYLPNPFMPLGEDFSITISGITIPIPLILLNILAIPILHSITYAIVGLYYSKGSKPAKGSFLYLFFYCVHTGLLYLMSLVEFNIYGVLFIIAVYLLLHIGFNALQNKICHFGI